MVYVRLPDLAVDLETLSYAGGEDGVTLVSPIADTVVTVDGDGFILDYPGLATRI